MRACHTHNYIKTHPVISQYVLKLMSYYFLFENTLRMPHKSVSNDLIFLPFWEYLTNASQIWVKWCHISSKGKKRRRSMNGDAEQFKTFDIVLNALDNLNARWYVTRLSFPHSFSSRFIVPVWSYVFSFFFFSNRHVNKMCMAANVPLSTYCKGSFFSFICRLSLTVVYKQDQTECFHCLPKPTPKTFLRWTPSQPIHCIV